MVVILVSTAHGTYYYVTAKPGRDVEAMTSHWRTVPPSSAAKGVASNKPDLYGRATLQWSGSNVRLDLHSETGSTQQGFHMNGGPVTSSMYFSAGVTEVDGSDKVACPLLYGIKTYRAYYIFRMQPIKGDPEALSYQIILNGPPLDSGFHGVLLDQAHPLPYVGNWNLLEWNAGSVTHLGLLARGDQSTF